MFMYQQDIKLCGKVKIENCWTAEVSKQEDVDKKCFNTTTKKFFSRKNQFTALAGSYMFKTSK